MISLDFPMLPHKKQCGWGRESDSNKKNVLVLIELKQETFGLIYFNEKKAVCVFFIKCM